MLRYLSFVLSFIPRHISLRTIACSGMDALGCERRTSGRFSLQKTVLGFKI